MHLMEGEIVDPHRLKSTGAHVQGQPGERHPLGTQCLEQGSIEMQSGRRRGHRTALPRIDCLVACLVVCFRLPLDVGWERQLAVSLDEIDQVALIGEAQ